MKIKHFPFICLLFISATARAEILPSIDAKIHDLTPLEISKTGRVYRFKGNEGSLPKTGSILLIQKDKRPIMAFRVLMLDSNRSEFIAKRVRRYDVEGSLKINESYTASEKLADIVAGPSAVTTPITNPAPIKEPAPLEAPVTAELANPSPEAPTNESTPEQSPPEQASPPPAPTPEPSVLDSELDQSAPQLQSPQQSAPEPAPTPNVSPTLNVNDFDQDLDAENPNPDSPEIQNSNINEISKFDELENTLGISIGKFLNHSDFKLPSTENNGFALTYSHVVDRNLYFFDSTFQDSLSVELGFTHYSVVAYTPRKNDGYTLYPLKGELLYTLFTSTHFAALAYGGLQFNLITSSENPSEGAINELEGFQTNFGVGLLYNFGPQWYLRGDLGFDRYSIGLAVRW